MSEKPLEELLLGRSVADTDVLPVSATAGLDIAQDVVAAAHAMMQNEEIRQTVGSLLAFRRGYAVAVRVLEEQVAAHKLPELVASGVVAHFTGAISQAAAEPFDESVLLKGFPQTVFPWMSQIVGRHSQTEAETRRVELAEIEERRRAQVFVLPVDWGIDVTPQVRERTLLVVGLPLLVRWAIAQIYLTVLPPQQQHGWCVAHLSHSPKLKTAQGANFLQFGPKTWSGCGNSYNAMARFVEKNLEDVLSRPLDLLVVDQFSAAVTCESTFASELYKTQKAAKRLRPWATETGCGVVGGLHTTFEPRPPLWDGDARNLSVHADVLRVWVEHEDDMEESLEVHCQLDRGDGTARRGVFQVDARVETLNELSNKLIL